MSDWQRTLDVTDVWDGAKEGDPTLGVLCGIIAQRLEDIPEFGLVEVDTTKMLLVEEFQAAAMDPELDVENFDDIWERLYDWADQALDGHWAGKKVCWVKTF